MQILLVVLFIAFVVLGVPISFALGFVSFAGIAALPICLLYTSPSPRDCS